MRGELGHKVAPEGVGPVRMTDMSALANPTAALVAEPAAEVDGVDQSTDRRAARRALTELALRAAALHLTEERGFDRFTVDEVAQRAGVSPRTFFNYFPTKEAAVLSDPQDVLDAMAAAFEDAADLPLDQALRAAVSAFLQICTRCPRDMRRELALVEATPVLRTALLSRHCSYERSLARLVAARLDLNADTDPLPLSIAAAVLAVARITLMQWSWGTDDAVSEALVDDTLARMGALLSH
jgi:AcrR family transcriptional regulator